jgi:hypothetical protein
MPGVSPAGEPSEAEGTGGVVDPTGRPSSFGGGVGSFGMCRDSPEDEPDLKASVIREPRL